MKAVQQVYQRAGQEAALQLETLMDFRRFAGSMRDGVAAWAGKTLQAPH